MEFVQEAWLPGIWLNDHPGRGLPPATNGTGHRPVRVPAITAACLMVSAALYRQVGGLDEDYVVGDFEDSDFCLKLFEIGRPCHVAPWISLVHLERQSQRLDGDNDWRQALTLYNAWLHTRRWSDVIERVTREVVHA
jgi:GT2 family glycosyltransferase